MANTDLINQVNTTIIAELTKLKDMLATLNQFHDQAAATAKSIQETFDLFLSDIGQFAPKQWTGDATILSKIETLLKLYEIK